MVSSHDCGWQIKDALESQRSFRTNRRGRKTRYRSPRFDNRSKPEGWLPPSLMSRIYNIETWFNRLRQRCLITSVSIETVRFDTQKMGNPEIQGLSISKGNCMATKCENICWRSSTVPVLIAAKLTYRWKWNISIHDPEAVVTELAT